MVNSAPRPALVIAKSYLALTVEQGSILHLLPTIEYVSRGPGQCATAPQDSTVRRGRGGRPAPVQCRFSRSASKACKAAAQRRPASVREAFRAIRSQVSSTQPESQSACDWGKTWEARTASKQANSAGVRRIVTATVRIPPDLATGDTPFGERSMHAYPIRQLCVSAACRAPWRNPRHFHARCRGASEPGGSKRHSPRSL